MKEDKCEDGDGSTVWGSECTATCCSPLPLKTKPSVAKDWIEPSKKTPLNTTGPWKAKPFCEKSFESSCKKGRGAASRPGLMHQQEIWESLIAPHLEQLQPCQVMARAHTWGLSQTVAGCNHHHLCPLHPHSYTLHKFYTHYFMGRCSDFSPFDR